MTITRQPFRGVADMPRILDLVRAMPLSCRHVIDLAWRLSSPAINEGRDAVYWEDSAGQVVAFAAWQYYWATLDFFPARRGVAGDRDGPLCLGGCPIP